MYTQKNGLVKIYQYNSKAVSNHRIVSFTHQIVTLTLYVNVRLTIKNSYVTIKVGRMDPTLTCSKKTIFIVI